MRARAPNRLNFLQAAPSWECAAGAIARLAPTMILFKGGEPAAAAAGAQPKSAIEYSLGFAES